MTIEERRHSARKVAFDRYNVAEFRLWASDKSSELSQQLLRLGTKKYDREELIRTALMVEDAIAMVWMLLREHAKDIESAMDDIYSEFESMQKESNCTVVADCKYDLHDFK